MKNKNRIRTNNIRVIRKAFPRFVSLMVMSLLGVFVFAGLTATSPDMLITLDQFLDKSNAYDVRVISDMGLMEEDITAIQALDCVEKAVGGKSLDILLEGENEVVIQCNTPTSGMNDPEILEGRMPEEKGEIAVESAFLNKMGYQLGDTISIDSSSLKSQSLKIVGIVSSPLYYNSQIAAEYGDRGSTSIGNGTVNFYAYIYEDDLDFDYYTVIYATVKGAKDLVTSSDAYVDLIDQAIDQITEISTEREQARYDGIYNDQKQAIDDAEKQAFENLQKLMDGDEELTFAQSKLSDSRQQLDDAKQQLEDANQQLISIGEQLSSAKTQLEDSAEELASYKALLEDAQKQLAASREELDSYETQMADAQQQLKDGKTQLDDSKAQLEDAEAQLAEAKAKLEDAKQQLEDGRAQLDDAEAQYEQALSDAGLEEDTLDDTASLLTWAVSVNKDIIDFLNSAIPNIKDEIASLDDSEESQAKREQLEELLSLAEEAKTIADDSLTTLTEQLDGVNQLIEARDQIQEAEAEYSEKKAEYDSGLEQYNEGLSQYEEGKTAYEEGLNTYQTNLAEYNTQKAKLDEAEAQYSESYQEYLSGKAQYDDGVAQYDAGLAEYESGLQQYESGKVEYESGLKEYESGEQAYQVGLTTYQSGKETYEESLNKYKSSLKDYDIDLSYLNVEYESEEAKQAAFEQAKADIAAKIASYRDELNELKLPNWYIYDRTGYSTYKDFINDVTSMKNLAKLFPLIFFAVAVLVSLISMSRMVEDDRMEIGTLKSLGFDSGHIRSKYLTFSLLATIVGGLIGAVGGLIIIPTMIYKVYNKVQFELPDVTLTLQLVTTLIGFGITILCVCGASVWTVQKVLKGKPSELMRPKAPKQGKKILLERIPGLWKRFSFSQKITTRNLFRYKKRVIITIIGVAGCTVLLLTGFGVRDSIVKVSDKQYNELNHYDGLAVVKQYDSQDFRSQSEITNVNPIQQISATSKKQSVYLFVAEDSDSLKDIVTLRDSKSGETISLEKGKVVITEKFAALAGLKVGDTFDLVDVNNNSYKLEISGIVDNYVYHYIYMTRETYESYGQKFSPNIAYFNTTDLSSDQKDQLAKKLNATGDALSITYKSNLYEKTEDMFESMNAVILILIILSAMLSFVVLFNLSNINISERRREIATLKVLGFYNNEVDSYITKETWILTGVGIVLGLVAGVFVCHMVVASLEADYVRLINHPQFLSYVWTGLLAILFTFIVNVITHFNLKKIDMIDSLKSIE